MSEPRLALFVDSAGKPSETFIRDHIRLIAPGRTVVISSDQSAAGQSAVAALTGIGGTSRRDLMRAMGAKLLQLDFRGVYPLPLAPGHRRALIGFLRAQAVTHVLVEHLHVASQVIGPIARAGFPVWTHAHGADLAVLPRIGRLRAALADTLRQSEGLFVPSKAIGALARDLGCEPEKITVSPCGVDPALFVPGKAEPGRCLMVGRLVPKKAPLVSLAAFAEVAEHRPDAHLDIVGDGPLRPEVGAFIAGRGLFSRVTLHGALPHEQVRALMARAQVFLQHSVVTFDGDREGLPVAILEAMSAGVAILATRHSGIPEAVTDGREGYLVAERDQAAFAQRLGAMIDDPETTARMGQAGRARVLADFTQDRMAARIRSAMGLPGGAGQG